MRGYSMMVSMILKIDGCNHKVFFQDNGEDVRFCGLKFTGAIQRGYNVHTELQRRLVQAYCEVVAGDVMYNNVDVKWHSVGE
jgi:hypothetical protein